MQQPLTEQREGRPAVHLTFERFEAVDLLFGLARLQSNVSAALTAARSQCVLRGLLHDVVGIACVQWVQCSRDPLWLIPDRVLQSLSSSRRGPQATHDVMEDKQHKMLCVAPVHGSMSGNRVQRGMPQCQHTPGKLVL